MNYVATATTGAIISKSLGSNYPILNLYQKATNDILYFVVKYSKAHTSMLDKYFMSLDIVFSSYFTISATSSCPANGSYAYHENTRIYRDDGSYTLIVYNNDRYTWPGYFASFVYKYEKTKNKMLDNLTKYELNNYTKVLTRYKTKDNCTFVTMNFEQNTDKVPTKAQNTIMETIVKERKRNILIYGDSRVGKTTIAKLLAMKGKAYYVKSSLSILDTDTYNAVIDYVRSTLDDNKLMIVTCFDEFDFDIANNTKQVRNMLDTTQETFGTCNIFTTNKDLSEKSQTYKEWNSLYLIKRFDLIIGIKAKTDDVSYSCEMNITVQKTEKEA